METALTFLLWMVGIGVGLWILFWLIICALFVIALLNS